VTVLIGITMVAFAAATAVLALSVAAKLADWETTNTVWPTQGLARRLLSPVTVTAVEMGTLAVLVAPAPVQLRLALLGGLYAGYAAAAVALRGRDCGCFGGLWPSRFTGRHIIACAAAAVGVLTGAGYPPLADQLTVQQVSGVAVASIMVGALVAIALLHRRGDGPPPPPERIARVVVYTSRMCSFCLALLQQRSQYQAMAGCPVEFLEAETKLDQQRAGGAYPAGVAFDAAGEPVYGPVHGIRKIRDLLRHTATGGTALESAAAGPAHSPAVEVEADSSR